MEYTHWSQIRPDHPNTPLETRPVHCPDDVTRLITMSTWFWDVLDMLYSEAFFLKQTEFLEEPFRFAEERSDDANLTVTLEQEITYWTERNYKIYQDVWRQGGETPQTVLGFRSAKK